MDTTLVTVTLLSMGMAAALSVIVWRMLRDERQRSEARVAALAALAARAGVAASRRSRAAVADRAVDLADRVRRPIASATSRPRRRSARRDVRRSAKSSRRGAIASP